MVDFISNYKKRRIKKKANNNHHLSFLRGAVTLMRAAKFLLLFLMFIVKGSYN